uniref:Jacalin-type lectin domain-containing protein n=1 Tax=Macrostomum lignano TaxID=282301 RepID=A0A1I8IGX2_9PLAT
NFIRAQRLSIKNSNHFELAGRLIDLQERLAGQAGACGKGVMRELRTQVVKVNNVNSHRGVGHGLNSSTGENSTMTWADSVELHCTVSCTSRMSVMLDRSALQEVGFSKSTMRFMSKPVLLMEKAVENGAISAPTGVFSATVAVCWMQVAAAAGARSGLKMVPMEMRMEMRVEMRMEMRVEMRREHGKVLLFSISAHSGKDALVEFRKAGHIDTKDQNGKLFRSTLLNNLPDAVRLANAQEIVAEMRKNGKAVASATFDVSKDTDKLNLENWFTKERLVKTGQYWIGKGSFVTFSIKGNKFTAASRNFYIQFTHGGCDVDKGFMGIGNSAADGCKWVRDGVKTGSGKVLLFTITAHSGKDALVEYRNTKKGDTHTKDFPTLFRASLLDNLPAAIKKYRFTKIVAEMRNNGKAVASATFDVSKDTDKLNSENWFTKDRLVKSYPYWIGKGSFVKFSIEGSKFSNGASRNFYIQFTHGGCGVDRGFIGIGNSAADGCKWVRDGVKTGPPVMFYSTQKDLPYAKDIHFADRLIIYFGK